jgi:hypothetical protein
MKEVISIPDASKTFKALRSLGYDINSSIADVIDNALSNKVKADNINVIFKLNERFEIVARIIDNGSGMNSVELEEAMRIGAESSYEKGDLGKFGLGMKTASLSHCNILTVISKKKDSEIAGYCWNLGHVHKANDRNVDKALGWSLLQLNSEEIYSFLNKEKMNIEINGTIVFWDQLTRLNQEYGSIISDKLAQNYLYRTTEKLKLHLRMVFHRFLDNSIQSRKINIYVNNDKLMPWDPFCRIERSTIHLQLKTKDSELYLKNNKVPIVINAFVLPTKENFSSENAWKEAKGLLSWNDSQGYYIYRADRLIRFGGWHGTKAKDEHDKLARISIDIDPSLDDYFSITVNKSKVEFPEFLFQHLKNVINPHVIKKAQAQYRREPERSKVNNKIRGSGKIQSLSKTLLNEKNITTKSDDDNKGNVEVINPSGTWLSNKLNEFLKYGNEDDFEIISDHIEGGHLWKIVCDPYSKFKVIINSSHPFYSLIYNSKENQNMTVAIDALLFSLAFGELYNKNNQNAHLFNTFKTVSSEALEKLVKEKVI